MPTLQEIRSQYPQYSDLSDQQLADSLYTKFYADMPRADFDAKIGVQTPTSMSAASGDVAADDEVAVRGSVLPLGRTKGGDITLAVPEFIHGPAQTIMDLLEGKRDASQISGREIFELGMLLGPGITGEKFLPARAAPKAPAAAEITASKPEVALSEGEMVSEAGKRLGVDLPRAVTSDSTVMQQAGKIASNIPVGGTPLREASTKALNQLDEAVTRVQDAYGSGSAQAAGAAAEKRITTRVGPKGVLADRIAARYKAVDDIVDPAVTRQLGATQKAAENIMARRENAKIGESAAVKRIREALDAPEGLDYAGTKDLRTYIGELLDKPSLLPADISQAELKQIYGALSDDLTAVVREAGGEEAVAALEAANKYAKSVAGIRESLNRILKAPSEEAIFAKIESLAGSNSRADIATLKQVRTALTPKQRGEIASAVIAKLGRAPDGTWTPDRFLTGYGKLSNAGKALLFGSVKKHQDLARALDDIATVSRRFKLLNQFANPSGTGQTVLGASLGTGLIMDPVTALTSITSARVLSHLLAQPKTARAAADWSKAYGTIIAKPTRQAREAFAKLSKSLALAIASELGVPQSVPRIAHELQGAVGARGDERQQQ